MTSEEIDGKLKELGKDRRWLADVTGYAYESVRDCLAPEGKGLSPRMASAMVKAITTAEASADGVLEAFTPAERVKLQQHAKTQGFRSGGEWVASIIRALLPFLSARENSRTASFAMKRSKGRKK